MPASLERAPFLIPSNEIIIVRKENPPIMGLNELDSHLRARGPLFFSILGAIHMDGRGWEKIEKDDAYGGLVKSKIYRYQDADTTFTGDDLCDFASFAIFDALQKRVQGVKLDVVKIKTDKTAETWEEEDSEQFFILQNHVIVQATDDTTGETRYYDPTYRQIDHRTVGTIRSFSEEELDKYYRTQNGQRIQPVSVIAERDNIFTKLRDWKILTNEGYSTLMETL